ncbi:MAG TPA: amidohydrolase family protein [Gaiellaceae bacterium]|nr:amidohydrolase family protein [Gaiellaceae bacterium]
MSRTAPTRRSRNSTRSPGSAPAWLAGDERRRGTLIPGHDADLVVLDRDPWEDLDAQVVATMVAGRWVHNPPPW